MRKFGLKKEMAHDRTVGSRLFMGASKLCKPGKSDVEMDR